jgi:hypothetical protein
MTPRQVDVSSAALSNEAFTHAGSVPSSIDQATARTNGAVGVGEYPTPRRTTRTHADAADHVGPEGGFSGS